MTWSPRFAGLHVRYDRWIETSDVRLGVSSLFLQTLLAAAPDHPGLFLRTKPELFVKARHACAEPEKFDFLETGVVQDALDDIGADALALVRLIDDDIPDGRPVDMVR